VISYRTEVTPIKVLATISPLERSNVHINAIRSVMRNHHLMFFGAITPLLLGCATSDDRAAVGRAAVNTVAYTAAIAAEGWSYRNCEQIDAALARDACFQKRRNAQSSQRGTTKLSSGDEFEDFETYKEKREAEIASGH
jgi:hypothetical protein